MSGKLKSNSKVDKYLKTWLDLARYNKEMLAAQSIYCFVL